MGAVSESMSIASALNTITHLSLPPGAWLILDFGGATVVSGLLCVCTDRALTMCLGRRGCV